MKRWEEAKPEADAYGSFTFRQRLGNWTSLQIIRIVKTKAIPTVT